MAENLPVLIDYLKRPAVAEAMRAACSKHVTPERLIKVACSTISRNPMLGLCTKESIYNALVTCGQLGLEPNLLGAAYLVPYRNKKSGKYEAQFIAGYRGLIELARRSGQIKTISAHCVREKDEFDYVVGNRPYHKPYLGKDDPGDVRMAWAIATFTDESYQVEVMTRREIDGIRERSKAKDSGPWVSDYPEMARKTVVRRLCKYLPLTIELADAFGADQEFDTDGAIDVSPGAVAKKTQGRLEDLKERMAEQQVGPDSWEQWRERWVNLKQPGFADFVSADPDTFTACPDEMLDEARDKWKRFYPDRPWPLGPVEDPEPATALEVSFDPEDPISMVEYLRAAGVEEGKIPSTEAALLSMCNAVSVPM